MTRTFLRSLTLGLGLLAASAFTASAATITYTVTNLTASGGDPTYSIGTSVTFTNLILRQSFADATTGTVTLYDFNNAAQTSLTPAIFDLNSLALNTVDPVHGNLTGVTLTGSLSPSQLSIVPSFGATPTTVVVNSAFSTTLPLASTSVNILAIAANGNSYAAGTLQSTTAGTTTPAVPEPATYGIASLGLGCLFVLRQRSRRA